MYISCIFVLVLVNSQQSPLLDIISAILVYSIFLATAYHMINISLLFNTTFFVLLVAIVEYLVRVVCFRAFDTISSIDFVVINVICLLSVFLLEKLLLAIAHKGFSWQYRRWFVLFLILQISCLVWLVVMIAGEKFMIYKDDGGGASIFSGYILLFSNILCFYFLERLVRTADADRQKQVFIQKQKMEQTYYEAIQEKIEQQARLLHDIKHHIQVVGQMAADEKNDGIVAYCKSITNIYTIPVTIEYTDNKIMNIILAEKADICRQKQIDFQVRIASIQLDFLDPMVVCTLFGNLLDNAIEGAKRCCNHKFIKVRIEKFNAQFIVLSVQNSCQKVIRNTQKFFLTTKPDKNKHGYGLKSIQQAVEEQGGTVAFECTGTVFKATILLHIPHSA